ncbi:TrbI/VirB10 family protein [Acidihalobacter ferrooxydans]|uniref:Conjugal transfer protein TrbI n=1 Tax=Acidihalobacter ferrooxydans TaxID=1765967 RepID=A0A1P8UFF0_9GAMM|nr:TrbI/VirB10 family protein [Acidihalobacter ferrooxydans]APZ42548.1 hypothetical protein BW247_05110 [Acidihalobacter ferrooxydans]
MLRPKNRRQEPPQPQDDDFRTGGGLPTRTLPILLAGFAIVVALIIALTGPRSTPAPTPVKRVQAPPQVQQKPSQSELQRLLGSLSGKQASSQDSKTAVPNPVQSLVPTPSALERHKANKGNVAASGLVALTGPGASSPAPTVTSASSTTPGNALPSAAALAKSLSGNNTSGLSALAALAAQKKASAADNAQHFLSSTQAQAGSGYGPVAHVLPKLKGAVLYPGVMLPATTITAVNTQLPGTVIAQVTNTVYGRNGRVAIPAGARLVGRYDTSITNGQTRILVAFQRLIFPDGREIVLGNSQATGGQGAAGVKGSVNNHFFTMLGSSLLVALIDQGVASIGPSQSVTSVTGTSASSPVQAGAQVFANGVNNVLSPYENMRPTAVIPAGTPINILVNKTIVMPEAHS